MYVFVVPFSQRKGPRLASCYWPILFKYIRSIKLKYIYIYIMRWEVQVMLTFFHRGGRRACSLRKAKLDPDILRIRGVQSCVNVLQVNVCLGILSARTCNADHGDILWKAGLIDMALTTGKAWAIKLEGSGWDLKSHSTCCWMHRRHRRALRSLLTCIALENLRLCACCFPTSCHS